ncbi:MAG: AAA family ATPase [Armatimonadetes bacterium]|nr:AAA family ATPase [Armatimonadota bacterium]NIM23563.1 AAA family ATPase [Armatimonadota bacterium]NIM67429.1 AAA family ATPase [Armatimonadota bacterium]NIM75930.1 AAA family ATPase [Armatimonadota bacterium]NIN05615.1 AAA family ATPase [Armatimonadota bacterium]
MKIAVAGKGGSGKTTLSAGLCRSFADAGLKVLAVDADSNNCLGYALGFPQEMLNKVVPLSDLRETLKERAGSKDSGGFFLLAPEVSDLLDTHAVEHGGLRLLVMGMVTEPGGGCVCPENVVLRALTRHLVSQEEAVILDMEAGVEHLGRGTATHVDWLLIVVEPNPASIRTAQRIASLGRTMGVPKIGIVANNVKSSADEDKIRAELANLPCLGAIPHDPMLENAAAVPWEKDESFRQAVGEVEAALRK